MKLVDGFLTTTALHKLCFREWLIYVESVPEAMDQDGIFCEICWINAWTKPHSPSKLKCRQAPGDSMFLIAWVKVDLDPLSSSGNCRTLSPTEITEGEQMVGNQGQATMTSTSSRHKEVRCWISILAQSVWEQSNHMQATRGQLKSACSEWISSSATRKFCVVQPAGLLVWGSYRSWMFLETMNQIW